MLACRFDQICGNEHAKRAAEVALAGGHKIVFTGAPDSQAEDLACTVNAISNQIDAGWVLAQTWQRCPCGYCGDSVQECTCSPELIDKWYSTHPLPLVDIYIEVTCPRPEAVLAWAKNGFSCGEDHQAIMARIDSGWASKLKVSSVDETSWALLSAAIRQLRLQPCQVHSVIQVGRTIAKLAGKTCVEACHMAEAIQYRPRE